ncbi:hypothetical protein [Streptomyces sp. NPDC089799]|uniref:hypothetical protein n=1 Tax=Streptomyces sp. NPDC089799 TaxID=3155066 RepID=UPI003422DA10
MLVLSLTAWARQRRTAPSAAAPAVASSAGRRARTYSLIGTRAADGNPVQLPSSRPAGTVVRQPGPDGRRRFELTDAVLSDGTYAAEPLDWYR